MGKIVRFMLKFIVDDDRGLFFLALLHAASHAGGEITSLQSASPAGVRSACHLGKIARHRIMFYPCVITVYRNLVTMDTVLHTCISLIVPVHSVGHS